MWKERLGLAKLAMAHGYPIVPFAAVGAEDMYDVVADGTTSGVAQISALMRRLVGVPLPPIPKGLGPTLVPRPERLYFWFGEAIETTAYQDPRDLRDDVRSAVHDGIARLQSVQAADPERHLHLRRRKPVGLPDIAHQDPDAWFVRCAFDASSRSGPRGAEAWLSRWVQLVDPPAWPGSSTWNGREAAIARLEQVVAQLGGGWIEVLDAHSTANGEVCAAFVVRRGADDPEELGRFTADIELDELGAISRIRVRDTAPAER